MPIYSDILTAPAGSTKVFTWDLEGDYITYVRLRFPPGPEWSLKVRFLYGNLQIFPRKKNTYFVGDDEIIEWQDLYQMYEVPFPLKIELVNDDTDNDHSVHVIVKTAYSYELGLLRVESSLKRFFRSLQALFSRVMFP